MRSRVTELRAVLGLLLLVALTGCGHPTGETGERETIPPASAALGKDLGLGSGVSPLSFGPGDKGSPRISPSGERVAFVLDGYVAEKPLRTRSLPRDTAISTGAEHVEWLPDESLAALRPEVGTKARSTLLGAQPGESSEARKLLDGGLATCSPPTGEAVVAAVVADSRTGSPGERPESKLTLVRSSEQPAELYPRIVKGAVTGLSISPDGREAALAVRRNSEDVGVEGVRLEVHTYRFSEGQPRRVARLTKGQEILGAPQWTAQGIHFVAGEADDPETRDASVPHYLYRVRRGSETPEPVRGVGEDFVVASAIASPDGDRLAVVGRRNPGAPTNLYILDLTSDTLEAATTNQNMEIKTNPRDLAWSPDGRFVILVARGALSGPKVYDAPASTLSSAFYNLYEVPVTNLPAGEDTRG